VLREQRRPAPNFGRRYAPEMGRGIKIMLVATPKTTHTHTHTLTTKEEGATNVMTTIASGSAANSAAAPTFCRVLDD